MGFSFQAAFPHFRPPCFDGVFHYSTDSSYSLTSSLRLRSAILYSAAALNKRISAVSILLISSLASVQHLDTRKTYKLPHNFTICSKGIETTKMQRPNKCVQEIRRGPLKTRLKKQWRSMGETWYAEVLHWDVGLQKWVHFRHTYKHGESNILYLAWDAGRKKQKGNVANS